MKIVASTIVVFLLMACTGSRNALHWTSGKYFNEQELIIKDTINKLDLNINAPAASELDIHKRTVLIFYALPNGNSIEWTKGKALQAGDDWHYDIQHIAAQTRYLRTVMKDKNVIVAYMAAQQKSWPAWKKQTLNAPVKIKRLVDSISNLFVKYHPEIVLDSHSGGGSFIFGYLDAVKNIPANIKRIAFIDSDYGYEDSTHGKKLTQWLQASPHHYLTVLAYNDSVVIYNGKPLVSPTGGTWYRTKMMQRELSRSFEMTRSADTAFIHYSSFNKQIDIWLKENPTGKIYHTEQVYRNGFIHTILAGTKYEQQAGYTYWGANVYNAFIK